MKTHTQLYKDTIPLFGRELDSIITYVLNNEEVELGSEELNSITPHYKGSILKSVMRQLDIDSNVEIPIGTILNYQFGIKIGEDGNGPVYEYLNFGNYIVYSVEKQEDKQSYKIICYDKMLYSMKDYETIGITYPITIRDYITAVCNHLNLTFKNENDIFANYDKIIQNELYLGSNDEPLGYTFRDVLDQLAQVTGSTICINEDDDELEIRYINDTEDTINEEYLKDINVNFGEYYGPINTIVLSRSGESDKVYKSYPDDLPNDEKIAIEISDNQIMNWNDRSDYLPDILDKLYGLQYYLNDFSSTGITYYNLCDKYNIQIGNNTYSCIMFNDEINITQGLEENIYTDMPEESETDYKSADKTDRRINQAFLIVNKQLGEINAKIEKIESRNYDEVINTLQARMTSVDATLDIITTNIDRTNGDIREVTTSTGFTFNADGFNISKEGEPTKSKMDEAGLEITDSNSANEELLFYSGYVNQDIVDKENSLEDYKDKSIVYTKDIVVKEYVAMLNGRFENVHNSEYGDGIGFFV